MWGIILILVVFFLWVFVKTIMIGSDNFTIEDECDMIDSLKNNNAQNENKGYHKQ